MLSVKSLADLFVIHYLFRKYVFLLVSVRFIPKSFGIASQQITLPSLIELISVILISVSNFIFKFRKKNRILIWELYSSHRIFNLSLMRRPYRIRKQTLLRTT